MHEQLTQRISVREAMTQAASLFKAGRLDETESVCLQVLAIRPENPTALQLLGLVEHRRSRNEAAAPLLKKALALRPQNAECHSNLGAVLQDLGQIDEALAHYQQALAIKPGFAEAHCNLGTLLGAQGELERAVAAYQTAIAFKADYADAYHNLGHALQDLNRPQEALRAYRQALAADPKHPQARWGSSWIMLLTGDYANGWRDYEERFRTSHGKKSGGERTFPQPRWTGGPLAGSTLLVHCEQGLGDTIQFSRFVPVLRGHGGPVVFECQPELLHLMTGLTGVDRLVPRPANLAPPCTFDCYVPLLSLPHILGTTLETIPCRVPYLRVDSERVRAWAALLKGPGLKVGLVWAGNPRNPNDPKRTCPPDELIPLADVDGVHLFSLQKEAKEIPPALRVTDLGSRLVDFADTAAIIAQLDLVISVDTAVAHLAGALGRPAWTLLPFAPDWRWLLGRSDSPWYPTMRLFRQERRGQWSSVVKAVVAALHQFLRQHRGPHHEAAAGDSAVENVTELQNQGVAAWGEGRREQGLVLLQRAAEAGPEWADAHYKLAVAWRELGQLDQAAACYRRAAALQPDAPEVHFNLGNTLRDLGRLNEAVSHYREALLFRPNYRKAHTNLANILLNVGKAEEAADHYRKALELDPTNTSAHLNLGTAWRRLGRLQEALACFAKALELKPGSAEALSRLGALLEEMDQPDRGLEHLQQALALAPQSARVHHNLAVLLLHRHGLTDPVLAHFEQAAALEPDWPKARHSLALARLASGDLERGFEEYEWRWRFPQNRPLPLTGPLWDGTPCDGRTILLWAEQGMGDAIQFSRYATLLAQQGARVLLGCPTPLVRLLATVPGVERAADRLEDLPPYHCHAPFEGLPRLFRTTLSTIPAQIPYLQPPANCRLRLKTPPGTRLRAGLVWAGNPAHDNDRRRSCPAELWSELLEVPDVAFWSLQKGDAEAGLMQLDPTGRNVVDLSPQLGDFADTAAAIDQLDLVISVDTAVAHLAGALGKKVWLLLPFCADWRWLIDRADSPWYPTMRLFRQPRPGDWLAVLARVVEALQHALADPALLQQQLI